MVSKPKKRHYQMEEGLAQGLRESLAAWVWHCERTGIPAEGVLGYIVGFAVEFSCHAIGDVDRARGYVCRMVETMFDQISKELKEKGG